MNTLTQNLRRGLAVVTALLMALNAAAALRIDHAPVTVALRGQSVMFRARAVSDAHPLKNVTLFYAVSHDAAPYKVSMYDSGGGWYTGSIPADLLSGLNQILYYIEVRDTSDATEETPWYTVAIRAPGTPPPSTATPPPATVSTPRATAPATKTPTAATAPEEGETSWTKPALIAGGALLVGGAAIAIANGGGGGGGGGGSSGTTTTNAAGTFSGTVTLCFQPPGGVSSCSSRAMTLVIDPNGVVSSDTLQEGKHLESALSGDNFLLIGSVSETNQTGEIQYLGTVVNNRIAGSIQGTATTPTGVGTYSGNFSAAK